jgi:hypothetical protein
MQAFATDVASQERCKRLGAQAPGANALGRAFPASWAAFGL